MKTKIITKFDSPALTRQSDSYPSSWNGKIPSRVRMNKNVRSDLPDFDEARVCCADGQEYDAWVNSHGALCAIFDDGTMLGLKPDEFTVVAWHNLRWLVGAEFCECGISIESHTGVYCLFRPASK